MGLNWKCKRGGWISKNKISIGGYRYFLEQRIRISSGVGGGAGGLLRNSFQWEV